MRYNVQETWKNIPNIIDRNLKHDYQISILIFDTTNYQMTV